MNEGNNAIVSIKAYATIRDINSDGTFNVSITKIGKTALKPEIVVRKLIMPQLEEILKE